MEEKKKEDLGLVYYSTTVHLIKEMSPLLTSTLAKVEELELGVSSGTAAKVLNIKKNLEKFQDIKNQLNEYAKHKTLN